MKNWLKIWIKKLNLYFLRFFKISATRRTTLTTATSRAAGSCLRRLRRPASATTSGWGRIRARSLKPEPEQEESLAAGSAAAAAASCTAATTTTTTTSAESAAASTPAGCSFGPSLNFGAKSCWGWSVMTSRSSDVKKESGRWQQC